MQALFESAPLWYWGTFVAVLGLVMGSFLSVCIYRIPLGLSIVLPRSHCPISKKPLPWYDNLPLVSYLFVLKGRGRSSGKHIPLRYPLLEALTALLYLFAFLYLHRDLPRLGVALMLIPWALVIAFIDLDTMTIPPRFTLAILPLVVALAATGVTQPFPAATVGLRLLESMEGSLVGIGLIMVVYFYYEVYREMEPFGKGDAHLFAVIGALFGPAHVVPILFLSAFVGLGFAIFHRAKSEDTPGQIPFGPAIVLTATAYYFLPIPAIWMFIKLRYLGGAQ